MFSSIPDGLLSLAVGLIGVILARWVFVNREQRRLGRKESWRETLPITMVGALAAGVIIWDRKMGLSSSAFIGLGVGWVTVVLLEVLGERVQQFFQTMLGATPPPGFPPMSDMSGHDGRLTSEDIDTPADMARLIDQADKIELADRRDKK